MVYSIGDIAGVEVVKEESKRSIGVVVAAVVVGVTRNFLTRVVVPVPSSSQELVRQVSDGFQKVKNRKES